MDDQVSLAILSVAVKSYLKWHKIKIVVTQNNSRYTGPGIATIVEIIQGQVLKVDSMCLILPLSEHLDLP